MLIMIKDKK